MARPIFQSESFVFPGIGINVDFSNRVRPASQTLTIGIGAEWDDAEWNDAEWALGDVISKDWRSISGIGIAGGLNISTNFKGLKTKWISTDVIYEVGGSL
jgi:hypothetical protein